MTTKDTIKENLDYSIFDLLNCYEIDGTEIKGGMAYIDSGEARILTDKLVKIVSSALTKQREDTLKKIESIYLEFGDDPKQALACVAEYVDISLNAKGVHSIDANGNCNHGCC